MYLLRPHPSHYLCIIGMQYPVGFLSAIVVMATILYQVRSPTLPV